MAGKSLGKIKVKDLNSLLTCVLCEGYFIDATTIIECLHSFCRTCIVHYLQTNKYCPTCEVQVHKTRPLSNIRSDQTLQEIVYKLVPGLFKNEMKRRRKFYSQEHISPSSIPFSSEKRGDIWGCDRLIFNPEDVISVSLEYYPLVEPLPLKLQTIESLYDNATFNSKIPRRYFRCPGALKVYHLKKLLSAKHNLQSYKKIDILYMHDYLKDQYTLVDLAYIYSWKRSEPLRLFYKVTQESKILGSSNFKTNLSENNCKNVPKIEADIDCSEKIMKSPFCSMAAAPSSPHQSRPYSPQMAEEPKEVNLEKPNCAVMPNPQNDSSNHLNSTPILKSVLKKHSYCNSYNSEVPNEQQALHYRHSETELHAHTDRTFQSSTVSEGNYHKKKKVTFSPDVVDACIYKNSRQRLIHLKSAKRSLSRKVFHLQNKVLFNKSS